MELKKKAQEVPDIMNLPKPRPGRSGARKAGLLALAALLIVGGAAFWLTRDNDTREEWRDRAASVIDNATSGTPLAGAGDLLRDAPPPPPSSVVNPSTAPGTLAGRSVQGTVSSSVDSSLPSGQSGLAPVAGLPGLEPGQAVAPKVMADSRVRPDFIEDLAVFLVSRYKPGPRGGSLSVSVQSVNQRYGSKMTGLGDGGQGGRASLLRYAFHPTMLQSLYALYAERFLEAVNREASARGFNLEQNRQLHMALAGRFVMLAGALEGVAAVPDLDRRLKGVERISQTVVDINSQMTVAVFELDQLREDKASPSQISTAQLRVDGLSARYRRALEERGAAQRSLVAAVRQGGGQSLDEDSLLFLAQWVDRRLRQEKQALASVQSAAGILRDLARRCAQAGAAAPAPAFVRPGLQAPVQPPAQAPVQSPVQVPAPAPALPPVQPSVQPPVQAPIQVGGQGR